MKDSTRAQGGLICIGVAILGAWFLLAFLQQSYWAIAIPVAIFVFFVLGLTFWIGYTIATIRVDPYEEPEPLSAAEQATVSAAQQATPSGVESSASDPGSSS
jgi:threonine/homoserine efflux transporter RhtA